MFKRMTMTSSDCESRIILYSAFGRLLWATIETPAGRKRLFGFQAEQTLIDKLNDVINDAAARSRLPEAKPWPWPPPAESDKPYRWLED
jgi:hypothetical protein